MDALFSVLSLAGPLSLAAALFVLALLSQRLGAVTRRAKTYRLIFVAVALISMAVILRLSFAVSSTASSVSERVIYSALMAVALTTAVVVSWRYWGWLLSEGTPDHDTRPRKERDRDHH